MNIAILSRNSNLYSTKRLIETGEKRGHKMRVVDPLKCNLLVEQKKPQVIYRGNRLDDVHAIIPRIGASITFYGSAVVRQFEMMRVFSAVESQAIMRSRDKLRTMQIFARAGLGLPKTVFTNYSRDVDSIIAHVGGAPLIIKLLEGTQGLGVVLADNKTVAASVIEAFHGLKARIIVQEYIREAHGIDIRAFVVDGEVVGAMQRKARDMEFRANYHRGGAVKAVQLTREEKRTAVMAAGKLGLGVAGVDMLRSSRGPLILEANSSPGLEGIEKATKADIAGKIIQYLERHGGKSKIQKDKVNA